MQIFTAFAAGFRFPWVKPIPFHSTLRGTIMVPTTKEAELAAIRAEAEEADRETLEFAAQRRARREAELAAMDKDTRYNEKNRVPKRHKQAMRRAGKAAPDWLSEDQKAENQAVYEEADQWEKQTGVKHDVDHKEPLVGVCPYTGRHILCGLHVPWNLRAIPRSMNKRRGNNHYPGWPLTDIDDLDQIPF